MAESKSSVVGAVESQTVVQHSLSLNTPETLVYSSSSWLEVQTACADVNTLADDLASEVYSSLFKPYPESTAEIWKLWIDLSLIWQFIHDMKSLVISSTLYQDARKERHSKEAGEVISILEDCIGVLRRIRDSVEQLHEPSEEDVDWAAVGGLEITRLGEMLEERLTFWTLLLSHIKLSIDATGATTRNQRSEINHELAAITRKLRFEDESDSSNRPSSIIATDNESVYLSMRPSISSSRPTSVFYSIGTGSLSSLITFSTGQRSQRATRWRHDFVMDINSGFGPGAPYGEPYKGVIEGREEGGWLPATKGVGRTGKAPYPVPDSLVSAFRSRLQLSSSQQLKELLDQRTAINDEVDLKFQSIAARVNFVNKLNHTYKQDTYRQDRRGTMAFPGLLPAIQEQLRGFRAFLIVEKEALTAIATQAKKLRLTGNNELSEASLRKLSDRWGLAAQDMEILVRGHEEWYQYSKTYNVVEATEMKMRLCGDLRAELGQEAETKFKEAWSAAEQDNRGNPTAIWDERRRIMQSMQDVLKGAGGSKSSKRSSVPNYSLPMKQSDENEAARKRITFS